MASKAFVIHLKDSTKEFLYIMVYGENYLQRILIMLHKAKYAEIDAHY